MRKPASVFLFLVLILGHQSIYGNVCKERATRCDGKKMIEKSICFVRVSHDPQQPSATKGVGYRGSGSQTILGWGTGDYRTSTVRNNQGCSSHMSDKVIVDTESLDKSEFLSIKEYLQSLSARCVVISDLSISGFDVNTQLDLKLQDKGTLDLEKYSCLFKKDMQVTLANLNMPDSSFSFHGNTCQRALMLHKFASNTFSKKKGSVALDLSRSSFRAFNYDRVSQSQLLVPLEKKLIFDPSKKERYKREIWKDPGLGSQIAGDDSPPPTLKESCQDEMRPLIRAIQKAIQRDVQGSKADKCWWPGLDQRSVIGYEQVVNNIYEMDRYNLLEGEESVNYEKVREARIKLEPLYERAQTCKLGPEALPGVQGSGSKPASPLETDTSGTVQ